MRDAVDVCEVEASGADLNIIARSAQLNEELLRDRTADALPALVHVGSARFKHRSQHAGSMIDVEPRLRRSHLPASGPTITVHCGSAERAQQLRAWLVTKV